MQMTLLFSFFRFVIATFVLMVGDEKGDDVKTLAVTQDEIKVILDSIRQGKSSQITDERAEKFVHAMRTRFAYESLRPRLAYEQKQAALRYVPRLSPIVESGLQNYEAKGGKGHRTDGEHVRPNSLEFLHKETVREFIARDGNGWNRTPPPSAIYLELTCSPPIPFDATFANSQTSNPGDPVNPDAYSSDFPDAYGRSNGEERKGLLQPYIAQDKKKFAEQYPLMIPSSKFFFRMHQRTRDEFVAPRRSGHVESLEQVSGFVPHRLDRRPKIEPWDYRGEILSWQHTPWNRKLDEHVAEEFRAVDRSPPPDAIWLLKSLELVSLLKSNSPAVYVSAYLPDMEKLANVETRSLNRFEVDSLHSLEYDEDLVIAARTNEIQLMGSIRASESCMQCHAVYRGALLGAFSYHLVRAETIAARTDSKPKP